MALDHLIEKARDHFNIEKPEDWVEIRPEWVRAVHGVGPSTLDHIRLYLAARGLNLKDDACPAFWQKNLQTAKIGGQISLVDTAVTEAFTVLIDSQEKQPWTFQGFQQQSKPLIVPIHWKSLGPSRGDYTIAGLEAGVHVERKSMQDAHGTFLAPPESDRGQRWRATLNYLAQIPCGAVVIECSMGQMLASVESRGKRSKETLRKVLHRQVLAWQVDFMLPFIFCDNRRLAEASALQIMRRFWKHETAQRTKQPSNDIDAVLAAL